MLRRLVLAGLLFGVAQAFAPAPIQWGGIPTMRLGFASKAKAVQQFQGAIPLEVLTMSDQVASTSPNEIPYFIAKPDKTIMWESQGLCIEAGDGDVVRVNRCTREPNQLWMFLPWGHGKKTQIQLKGTEKCIDVLQSDGKEGTLSGIPVELRDCNHRVTQTWEFDQPLAFPKQGPITSSQHADASPSFSGVNVLSSISLAVIGALTLGASFWTWHKRVGVTSVRQGGIPYTMDHGGVCLAQSLAVDDGCAIPNRDLGMQERVPAVMSLSPQVDDGFPRDEIQHNSMVTGRRNAVGWGLAAAAASFGNVPSIAAEPEPTVKMYFGAGCFWHVQHEFYTFERDELERTPTQATAVSGYAGGTRIGSENAKACYHNVRNLSDYGQLGHTEAVQVEIPESEVPRFAQKYFSLFGSRGIRHDPQDAGGEYRSVIGLPGGAKSPLYDAITKVPHGQLKLVLGKGDEPDTIGDRTVLVYDSNEFPFYPAEVYHQFHNDFMGPPYEKVYNDLQKAAFSKGAIKETGCPDRLPQV